MALSTSALRHPIVQAPLAGGPSTVALAAAVSRAGGLGFLAAGYRDASAVGDEVEALRQATLKPFGVNVFAPPGEPADPRAVERYATALEAEGPLGTPRHDDDDYADKLALVEQLAVPVVSFTFGCPDRDDIRRLQGAGCTVWVTVTTPAEARSAAGAGADALVVQGVEAGGHRGTFDDRSPGDIGLLALLRLVAAETPLPLIASGGIADGAAIAAVVAAGAGAAQLGTAFMLCPEAGTSAAHRAALRGPEATALTRAFTGRTARGIVNRFLREHEDQAPSAYPEIHHLTARMRAAARDCGRRRRLSPVGRPGSRTGRRAARGPPRRAACRRCAPGGRPGRRGAGHVSGASRAAGRRKDGGRDRRSRRRMARVATSRLPTPALRVSLRRPSRRSAGIALVVLAVLIPAGFWFRDSPLVAVNHVRVTGVSGDDATAIRGAIADAAQGMSTLHVDSGRLRDAVSSYPVVAGIDIHRAFPHTLRVVVHEHVAVAALAFGSRRDPVAADGTVLADESAVGLPLIPVTSPPAGERLVERTPLRLAALLGAAPLALRRHVGHVELGSHGLTAFLVNGPRLYFGPATRLHAKWIAAARVLADPYSHGAHYIELRVPEYPAAGGFAASNTQGALQGSA